MDDDVKVTLTYKQHRKTVTDTIKDATTIWIDFETKQINVDGHVPRDPDGPAVMRSLLVED